MDAVLPVHPKELPTVVACIETIQRRLPQIKTIYTVSPDPASLPSLPGVIHKAEPLSFGGVTLSALCERFRAANPQGQWYEWQRKVRKKIYTAFTSHGLGVWRLADRPLPKRGGWIWQQLLKLGADQIVPEISGRFLVCDADVLWIRPVIFPDADCLYQRVEECHAPYFVTFRRLMGVKTVLSYSTIRHHCVFSRPALEDLKKYIAKRHRKTWQLAIVDTVDYREGSSFAEYDLYPNWCLLDGKPTCMEFPLTFQNLPFIPNMKVQKHLARSYDYVACHQYMRQQASQAA